MTHGRRNPPPCRRGLVPRPDEIPHETRRENTMKDLYRYELDESGNLDHIYKGDKLLAFVEHTTDYAVDVDFDREDLADDVLLMKVYVECKVRGIMYYDSLDDCEYSDAVTVSVDDFDEFKDFTDAFIYWLNGKEV